jgi:hypothetical protein
MAKNTEEGPNRKRIKRKGVHAKTQASRLKGSKNYLKRYKGQGR